MPKYAGDPSKEQREAAQKTDVWDRDAKRHHRVLTMAEMTIIHEKLREHITDPGLCPIDHILAQYNLDRSVLDAAKKRMLDGKPAFAYKPMKQPAGLSRKPFSWHADRPPTADHARASKMAKRTPIDRKRTAERIKEQAEAPQKAVTGILTADEGMAELTDIIRKEDLTPVQKANMIKQIVQLQVMTGSEAAARVKAPDSDAELRDRLRRMRECVGPELFMEVAREPYEVQS